MRAWEFITEAEWDPSGWGGTPFGTDIDYFGIRVKMRPSTFLKLAAPLDRTQMNPVVKKHMRGGGKIAYPMLEVKIPEGWEEDDLHDYATVESHEGRNRVTNWIEMHGDDPIQVNIIGRGGMRRRHFTPEIIERLSQGMYGESNGENRRMFVRGPLFDVNTVLEEDSVNEIGYAPGINNSKISDSQFIREGKPVGEIDNHTVWHWIGKDIYKGNHAYFFADSDNNPTKVLCRIGFADYGNRFELTTLKNISGVKGAITALCVFVAKKLNKPFILPDTEPLTQDGINWLCNLIRDKGRGLKLSDQTGNFPDENVIRQEWINAKYNGGHGNTSIMFENNVKSIVFKPKIKRIDEVYQWLEKSLNGNMI